MSHLIITPTAIRDIARCRTFLAAKSPAASRRAIAAIRKKLSDLLVTPEMGRPSRLPEFRELIIDFGDSGYIARYRYDADKGVVHVVSVWHQREADF